MSDPNWISAFLSNENSAFLDSIAITMSQIDEPWEDEQSRIPETEPFPSVNYDIAQKIIEHLGSKVDKQDAKGYQYLIEARTMYYTAHRKFQHHFNGLQDAKAYDTMLKAEEKKLEDMGDAKSAKQREKLQWTKINMQKNDKDIEKCLAKVQECWQMRKDTTVEFSRMKTEFVETVLPRLIEAGEKAYAEAHPSSSSAESAPASASVPTTTNPHTLAPIPESSQTEMTEDPADDAVKSTVKPIKAEETKSTSDDTAKTQEIPKAVTDIQAGPDPDPDLLDKDDPLMINTFSNEIDLDIEEWLKYMD